MPKRILQGVVTSDKNEQTITVLVERRFKHPVLQKTIRKSKKYRAHDETNQFKTGDTVRIEECAPISKTKRWTGDRSGVSPNPLTVHRYPGGPRQREPPKGREIPNDPDANESGWLTTLARAGLAASGLWRSPAAMLRLRHHLCR